jgi:5-methylcytosine-specific restriction endonuclease McrA
MQEPVLVLNATYEPINVTAVRRAMVLLLKGVAQAEEMHSAEVHSAAHSHKVPSVIRLLAYRHIPQQSRALSRKNILLRDRNTCQFCGRIFPSSELTLDHVIPRSRGGLRPGKSGGVLLPLQQQQRRSHAGRGRVETGAQTASIHAAYISAIDAIDWTSRRTLA